MLQTPVRDLTEVTGDGGLVLNFHEGQLRAWNSEARFTAVLAGTQSGKTSWGPIWLHREIALRGPGDYYVVTPTFPLLQLKALPEFLRLFGETLGLGKYTASPVRVFRFSEEGAFRTFGETENGKPHPPTNVYFGHAQDPDSLESATAKAAWLDEAGQKKFKLDSWQAILRRLALHMGRALLTTTVYNLGWLKQQFWDKWKAGDRDYEVVNFESIANPMFPREEWNRAKRDLPKWKFDMMYRGLFTRPAGLIYDSFNERHKIPRFSIPDSWPRYLGLDFGGVNTVGVFYAEKPGTKELYAYREYRDPDKTAKQHVDALLKGEPEKPTAYGGAASEDQWRREFRSHGLNVKRPPVSEVEVGIDRVYGAHKRGEIYVFDDLTGYLEEKMTYSRKVDEDGEVLEEIEDKHAFHHMDAERYIVSHLRREKGGKVYSF